jgi:hypothetical protein
MNVRVWFNERVLRRSSGEFKARGGNLDAKKRDLSQTRVSTADYDRARRVAFPKPVPRSLRGQEFDYEEE